MILVTGSGGFIGKNMMENLRRDGYEVFGVDYHSEVQIDKFSDWWDDNSKDVEFVIHLGAITDTLCEDESLLTCMNVNFTKIVWFNCMIDKVPLIYASSAATYGDGANGYSDEHSMIEFLQPLNLYAKSKHIIDRFTISQKVTPPNWYGLKFFNVYGYNESSKGKMASMIHQGHQQILTTGKVKLFDNGKHMRDFVYVQDVISVIRWLMEAKPESGIYNVGTGVARSFNDMMDVIFDTMKLPTNIEYIPMPDKLRTHYQDFTQADIDKLIAAGYPHQFHTLEEGISDFLKIYDENSNKPIQQKAKK